MSTPPTADERDAIAKFCAEHQHIAAAREHVAGRKRELSQQIKTLREMLAEQMRTAGTTCLRVRSGDEACFVRVVDSARKRSITLDLMVNAVAALSADDWGREATEITEHIMGHLTAERAYTVPKLVLSAHCERAVGAHSVDDAEGDLRGQSVDLIHVQNEMRELNAALKEKTAPMESRRRQHGETVEAFMEQRNISSQRLRLSCGRGGASTFYLRRRLHSKRPRPTDRLVYDLLLGVVRRALAGDVPHDGVADACLRALDEMAPEQNWHLGLHRGRKRPAPGTPADRT